MEVQAARDNGQDDDIVSSIRHHPHHQQETTSETTTSMRNSSNRGTDICLRHKYILTTALYLTMLSMGLSSSMMGPVRRDLMSHLKTDFSHFSYATSFSAVGSMSGALLYAVIYCKANRHLVLIFTLLAMSGIIFTLSQTQTLWSFTLLMICYALCAMGIEVAVNAWILELWQRQANAFMQGLHSMHGIGMSIGPLIEEPFLSKDQNNGTEVYRNSSTTAGEESRILIPFSIFSSAFLVSASLLLVLFFKIPYTQSKRSLSDPKDQGKRREPIKVQETDGSSDTDALIQDEDTGSQQQTAGHQEKETLLLIILSCFLMFFYAGTELSTLSFLTEFVLDVDLRLSKSTAAYMQSVMASAYAVNRIISILIALKMRTKSMISVSFVTLVVGNVLLLSFANTSESMIWLSIVMIGAGSSCIFPAIMSNAEEKFNVTTTISSAFLVSATLAFTTVSLLMGSLIQDHPLTYVLVNLVGLTACAVIFQSMTLVEKRSHRYNRQTVPVT